METKKVTAVDWLLDQMFNKNKLKYERGIQYILPELVNQAKAMEKEQMKDAWKDSNYHRTSEDVLEYSSEEYYNETYGK